MLLLIAPDDIDYLGNTQFKLRKSNKCLEDKRFQFFKLTSDKISSTLFLNSRKVLACFRSQLATDAVELK